MDKKYYIAENGHPQGPFTIEELCGRGITAESRIFAKGWSEFRSAGDIPEIAQILNAKPTASKEIIREEPANKDDISYLIRKLREAEKRTNY